MKEVAVTMQPLAVRMSSTMERTGTPTTTYRL